MSKQNAIKISPSILSADLLQLKEQIAIVEQNGADFIHVDVMDGQFVPNITFGPVIVKTLKKITRLPLDVHLMIYNADRYITEFADAGADILTVHQEALPHLHSTIQMIRACQVKPGVSINPATSLSAIENVLGEVDLVLIMTVNPGFGAQKFLEFTLNKIAELATLREENGYSFMIEVDGGINSKLAPAVIDAGADVLVAGNAIFGASDIGAACRELKQTARNTRARND